MHKICAAFLCLLPPVPVLCQLAAPTAISDAGYSSCSDHSCLFVPDDARPTSFHHGVWTYAVSENGEFVLSREGKTFLSTRLKDLSASVFVTWSPGNDWFAVTWSDGGAIGKFHTRVFHVTETEIREHDSVNIAYEAFRKRHWCQTRGDNLQAFGWDRRTAALVLVASVYPTGDCGKDLGHTEAYLVHPDTGAILRHLNLREFNLYAKAHPQ